MTQAWLRREAEELKKKFNEQFWMEDKGYFAMALDAEGKCEVVSSNPAQCLWSGIIDEKYSRHVVERIFEPDMFTGWGIRTLSAKEVRYNPLGYHIGTVWPHDNSIIACGLYRYGFYDQFFQPVHGHVRGGRRVHAVPAARTVRRLRPGRT